ncbi:MAG: SDR family NAD(P)-dependent oxidoreductase [Bacilli bacterium]
MKALITGASSGIGRDMSYYLSELGYDLIIVARDKKALEEVAKKCQTEVKVIAMDLSVTSNCFKLYDTVKDEDIDILINGAGFGLFGMTVKTDLERELEMIDLNIKAVHILTKLFLKKFVQRDRGYIMNIASSAGFLAGPRLNTYYATKNYVAKWTMAIYEELRRDKSNVHICTLCPGPVRTNFNKVAGGTFAIKEATSEYVAKYGIDKMFKNKLIIIPKFSVKLGTFLNRFIPWKLSLRIVYRIQKRKSK